MRFKTSLRNIKTFTKFTASLASIGKIAWVRLDDDNVRFTIIPEQGSQVWACLSIDSVFFDYSVQSRAEHNTINLELPLAPLQAALKSAAHASAASLRLTKRDGDAILSLTIVTPSAARAATSAHGFLRGASSRGQPTFDDDDDFPEEHLAAADRDTVVTQDIPIRILSAASVEGIHEPRVREPDVHILLPPLLQLKAISERFTRLALTTSTSTASTNNTSSGSSPKLELRANMHGSLRLSLATDALAVASAWDGLENPALDAGQVGGGEAGVQGHPSERMREAGAGAWAGVRIDGRDWGRVLSVGRLGGRVVACFVDQHALILYVYLTNYEDSGAEESVLTYYISSYAA